MKLNRTALLFLPVAFAAACDSTTSPEDVTSDVSLSVDFEGASLRDWSQPSPGTFHLNIRKDTNSDFSRWYSFRVQGAQGEPLIFRIMNAGTVSAAAAWAFNRPVVSADGGDSWARISQTDYDAGVFVFQHTPVSDDEWIALNPVYNFSRWEGLVGEIQGHAMVDSVVILTHTLGGRPVHMVKITDPSVPDSQKGGIWAIARQHPAETGGSWMAEGLLQWLLSSSPQAAELRRQVTIYMVPFMNPDGVALGNYRVNSVGANLNREWVNRSYSTAPSVAAVADEIESFAASGRPFEFFVDFHAYSSLRKNFFFYSGPDRATTEAYQRTAALMARFQGINGDFTQAGSSPSADGPTLARGWAFENFGVQAVTFECSYQDVTYGPHAGGYMTVARYLALGEALGQSLAEEFFGIGGS
jgi:murein tripeptide amidase MpaA